MTFTIAFLWNLAEALVQALPLFLGLGIIIALISLIIGRHEGWSIGDSLYFGFITALTVGYGDLRPTDGRSKFLSIVLSLFGVITAGILVAISVDVVSLTAEAHRAARSGGA